MNMSPDYICNTEVKSDEKNVTLEFNDKTKHELVKLN